MTFEEEIAALHKARAADEDDENFLDGGMLVDELFGLLERLHAAYMESEGQQKWLPIADAPKDGTKILLWDGNRKNTYRGYWETQPYNRRPQPFWQNDCTGSDIMYQRTFPPTHFMPLPAPPVQEES